MKIYRMLILILFLVVCAVYITLPNSPGIHILGINRDFKTHLGLDLVGGIQALLEADLPADQTIDSDAMDTAKTIVENRVNGLGGVNEAIVQQAGDRRIVVEIPGETDPEHALSTIQKIGLLEFVDMSQLTAEDAAALQGTIIQTDYSTSESDLPIGSNASIYHTIMTGTDLKSVSVTTNQASQPQVAFQLNADGKAVFGDFTSNHVGNVLAIVLDKQVISTPVIDSAITGGSGVITGRFTSDEANHLAVQLRYGSLPVPLKVISSQSIGPTLGQNSLSKSLVAGVIGLSVVILYMAIYYRLPGIIADIALILVTSIHLCLIPFDSDYI